MCNGSSEKTWYAIYTKPKWEKKVSELLTKKKIENFCPLNRVIKQWADRKKLVHVPLFSCYVFVHIDDTEMPPVRQTEGVLSFVHWLGKPARIRTEEIDTLKQFLDHHEGVRVEKIRVNIQDKVRIINGPFIEMEGNVTEVKRRTIKVLLPGLGYAMIAEIKTGDVELIQKDIKTRSVEK